MGVPQKSRSLFLPLPSPLAFSSAPRRGERRRGRGGEEPRRGDEREWRPLLWWGPGQRAAGRTRSGFSSRGLAFSFAFWWGFSSSSSLSRAAVRCERGISARLPARPPAVWTADSRRWGVPVEGNLRRSARGWIGAWFWNFGNPMGLVLHICGAREEGDQRA